MYRPGMKRRAWPDPETAAADLIDRLEHSRSDALPEGVIPPADHGALDPARAEARAVAASSGRLDALARAQHTLADWTLGRYQRAGFRAAYLSSWLDAPERRVEVVDVMVDAVTAYALADLLSDESAAALLARFEAVHDEPSEVSPIDGT